MHYKLMDNISFIKNYDEEIATAEKKELKRQQNNLELIASENIASPCVIAAMGSILTNKYAEGYPSKRYYGGCEFVDEIENIAIERAKKLFNVKFANVQPHCGSSANLACYFAFLNPKDTVLGMSLDCGGHLTHGSRVNISGKYFNFVPYGLNKKDELIDYDELERLAIKHKPKLIVAGASSYPRIIDFERIGKIAKSVNAIFMVDIAHIAGLICTGLHPSPFPDADVVTSTTHKTLRGPRGGLILTNNEEIAKKIDKAIFPGIQGGPLVHIIAAKAVCFKEAMEDSFKIYQQKVIKNAKELANQLKKRGFSLVSGTTDNHLILLNLKNFNITGKELEEKLDKINITVNKNAVFNDPKGPFITSGIRIGTPAITTRGLKQEDMEKIAECIYFVVENFEKNKEKCIAIVKTLTEKYPIY